MHLGLIKASNLCTEIVQYSSTTETSERNRELTALSSATIAPSQSLWSVWKSPLFVTTVVLFVMVTVVSPQALSSMCRTHPSLDILRASAMGHLCLPSIRRLHLLRRRSSSDAVLLGPQAVGGVDSHRTHAIHASHLRRHDRTCSLVLNAKLTCQLMRIFRRLTALGSFGTETGEWSLSLWWPFWP